MQTRPDIRNVAIIAHVDHGKTTLVDAMLWQCGIFRANEHGPRAGHGLDRPRAGEGHHDHGEEHVDHLRGHEDQHRGHARPRGLRRRGRADPDAGRRRAPAGRRRRGPAAPDPLRAAEGARGRAHRRWSSSTRSTAQDARPAEVLDEVYDLFIDLDADESQLDFPVLYTDARTGIAKRAPRRARAHPRSPSSTPCSPRCPRPASTRPWASSSGRPPSTGTTTSAGSSSAASSTARSASTTASPSSAATARSSPPRSRCVYGYEGLRRVEVRRGRPRGARRGGRHRDHGDRRDPGRPRAPGRAAADAHRRAHGRHAVLLERLAVRRAARASTSPRGSSASASGRRRAPTWPSGSRRPSRPTPSACPDAASSSSPS